MLSIPDDKEEYVYFLYSEDQFKMRTEIESSINMEFIPGRVLVMGDWKEFTQISDNPFSTMFADSKVVAEGYISKIKYEECSSKWKII